MKLKIKLILAIIVLSIAVIGFSTTTMADQTLGGTITQDTTLTQDTYNVTSNLTINSGVTVTVEAGSIFRLGFNKSFYIYGNLIMEGTEENRVVITSTSDPDYGRKWKHILEQDSYRKHGKS